MAPLIKPDNVFISCGEDLVQKIANAVPEVPLQNFIVEPVGRDTAPCIALSVVHIMHRQKENGPDAVIAVLPADHIITKPGKFRNTLSKAAVTANNTGMITTIGILPDRPCPSYGHIQPGKLLNDKSCAMYVKRFVEKPDLKTAARYTKSGYFWNAGMFLFRPDTMIDAFKIYLPDVFKGIDKIADSIGTKNEKKTTAKIFPGLKKISIDYGIMEKVKDVAVVPGDFGWTDIGGWDSLYIHMGGDGKNNISEGTVHSVDSTGCYTEGKKMVALVGVEDLVIIDTDDVLLIAKRGKEDELKKMTDKLNIKGLDKVL